MLSNFPQSAIFLSNMGLAVQVQRLLAGWSTAWAKLLLLLLMAAIVTARTKVMQKTKEGNFCGNCKGEREREGGMEGKWV